MKLDLRRYYLALKKKNILLIVVIILSSIIGTILNLKVQPNEYVAKSSAYIKINSTDMSLKDKDKISTYEDVILSMKVSKRAKKLLADKGFDEYAINDMISCSISKNSPVIYINAIANDGKTAMEVADAVLLAFQDEMNEFEGKDKVQILDYASGYTKITDGTVSQVRNILVITLIGTLISIILIVINSILSKRIETINDVTLNGEIEILGVIPNFDVE